ncbi:MAG: TOMM system kinase/cyclase fusion protein [Myxococcota bacterium]|nr:TOMM system kinase/cyclase fusion protein [Myxococcota bacterium]
MEPAATRLVDGSVFEDRYEIEGQLGAGSFGCVYRARQLSTGQSVALKVLGAPEGAERFRRELQICAALSHPNIVPLFDCGETAEGRLYAVFGHVPGVTLEEALAREGALGVRESLRLMGQVLDALACAHGQGIVHRDLKPANVMLCGSGARRNALVLDFGLGGLAEGPRRRRWRTLTRSREFVGTPFYAAPEQLTGGVATTRSDLYAWGLVLLECLTGSHPFDDERNVTRLLAGEGAVEIPAWLRVHRLGRALEAVTSPEVEKRDTNAQALLETLDEIAGGELPVAAGRPAPLRERGERRHLTVVFCDLVDSSELSQRLDPEVYGCVLERYRSCCEEVVARYDGHVAQYLGDGVLVYFGYPRAHEDDAERAVRAAREVVREVAALDLPEAGRLSARVGIHTGLAVVGESGGGDRGEGLARGAAPNIAARLQARAEPGAVLISDATLRLVAGLFEVKDLGTPELKGIREPVRVLAVRRASGVRSRLDRAPALTPLVGREQELGLLLDRFEQAREEGGQAILISGEAGIGKSRLVRELRERLRETPHTWLECGSSPYASNSALHPVIELVQQGHGFTEELPAEEKVERLERSVAQAGLNLAETVPLLAPLLSLPLPERYAPLAISPQLQRQRTLEVLRSWVLELGERQPVLLVVEDLHWADPTTLEWLGLLIQQIPTAGVLLVLTFRPEFEPPWPTHAHLQPLTLGRLRTPEVRRLAAGAVSDGTLPDSLLNAIAGRSDGVPLFAEELARNVVESGGADPGASLSRLEIPETLQDSLMARLDRLGDAKQVAQVGAALGRAFPHALLEAVAPLRDAALRDGLSRLTEAELLYQRGVPPKASYVFKHALVQDAAYQSLLKSQRHELHERIADALGEHFPERVAREPEEIARHCEAAGRTAQAVGHFQRAGERATQRWAHPEAIGHLHRALALLGTLPEGAERNRQELELQLALGPSLTATRGYGDPELERAFGRARELCGEIGESAELVRALVGLSLYDFVRGHVRAGADLAEQALAVAERVGEAFPLQVAHTRLGINLAYLGEPLRGLEHLEQAIRLHDPARHAPLEAAWGQGIGVSVARLIASIVLWMVGHPDRARRLSREAIELAREGDPFDLAQVLAAAEVLHCLREPDLARERTEEAIAIAQERGYPFLLVQARMNRGWALGSPRGLEELEESLGLFRAAGVRVFLPSWFCYSVEANLELGRPEAALAALEAALVIEKQTDVRPNPDLHRLEGEILLRRGGAREAEGCFRHALELARKSGTKSWELRAATSLARLLRDRGERDEACALLQPVYDWFTEGFDTADLKHAKALLEELRPRRGEPQASGAR